MNLTKASVKCTMAAGGDPEVPKDKYAYDQQYIKQNITFKNIPFNKNKPEDQELLEWIGQQPNFSQYVKQLIQQDKKNKEEKPE